MNNSPTKTKDIILSLLLISFPIAFFAVPIWLLRCNTTCKEQRAVEQQQLQAYNENLKIQQNKEKERLAEIERNKTPEQRQLELMERQTQSLKYLENSRQIHDTIEVVSFGLNILSTF